MSVLAYVGLRPGEALALRWRDIGAATVLIERANDDGAIKRTKTGRARSARLMAPVRADLQAWRLASGRPGDEALVFPTAAGEPWREHDWRNWRRRTFQPAVRALGLDITRPYDLRHAAVSLALHEGRSVVEVAAWLGHAPSMTHSTYAHVVDELRDSPQISAEEASARRAPTTYPPRTCRAPRGRTASVIEPTKSACVQGIPLEPTPGLEPGTPSLREKGKAVSLVQEA